MDATMALIFISYCSKSEDKVNSLVEDLKALGHQVWVDEALTGGQTWWNLILDEILKCDIFAFAIDRHSLASQACMSELDYAVDLKRTILPVRMADDVSAAQLPAKLAEIHWVDYCGDERQATRNLVRATGSLPKPEQRPNPLPTPPDAPISYKARLRDRIMTTETLSFEAQSALLVELMKALRESSYADDDLALLSHFRSRNDLLASIAAEIDEFLATFPKKRVDHDQRQLSLLEKLKAILRRIFGHGRTTANEDPAAEVLSLKQIWISLVGGLLISGILDRLTYGSQLTLLDWLILQPTWSLPGAILLFSSAIWKMLYFRSRYLRLGLIVVPVLIGYLVPIFPVRPDDPWVSAFAGAVIALVIVIVVFWNDSRSKPTSLMSAGITLGGALAGLVVLRIYGGRGVFASMMLPRALASIFGIYILFIFGQIVITRLRKGPPAQ